MGESSPARSRGKRVVWTVFKVVFAVVVLAALARQVVHLVRDWSNQPLELGDPVTAGLWLVVSAAAYAVGQFCYSLYWHGLLDAAGVSISRFGAFKAYAIGTIGKYVPGKAAVAVLRTALVPKQHGRLRVGLTVLYETLTMMAVGSALAAVCLFLVKREDWSYWAGSITAAVCLAATLHPIVFHRIARIAAIPFKDAACEDVAALCYQRGRVRLVLTLAGWIASGASFLAAARALGITGDWSRDMLLFTGAAACATAAGFLVLVMPAGVGVRELVLIHLLAGRCGRPGAVVASLLLRTIWTVVEVFLAGILFALRRSRPSERDVGISEADRAGAPADSFISECGPA